MSDEKDYSNRPIICRIHFRIFPHEANKFIPKGTSLEYEGKAGPGVSTGGSFSGATPWFHEGLVEEIIESERKWLEKSYHRAVKVKHTVVDERK